jgi:hypothetical protein
VLVAVSLESTIQRVKKEVPQDGGNFRPDRETSKVVTYLPSPQNF